MKTKNRNIIQITLIFFGLLLILLTYYFYPKIKEKQFVSERPIEEEGDDIDRKENYFENVEYTGLYKADSSFIIKSEKALIANEEPEIVHMTNMRVVIEMKDGRVIVITSKKGIYNKTTYDCYFQDNVKATDNETTLLSDNIDLLASRDTATVYNNVIMRGKKGSLLMADKIDYDVETKYYKISMFDDKRVKVKLTKWVTWKNLGS